MDADEPRHALRQFAQGLSRAALRGGLALGALGVCACAALPVGETTSAEPVQARSASLAQAADDPPLQDAEGRFAVHEWGLVVAGVRSGLAVSTSPAAGVQRREAPPPRFDPRGPMPAKPVFYVHLDDGLDAARIRLSVRSVSRGRVVEHFPPAVRQERNTGLSWDDVLVRRGACRGVYPDRSDEACQTDDGVCELAELGAYETTEAACLQVGGVQAGLLFYRMVGARDTLPLDVRPNQDGSVQLRSVGAPPTGLVLRIHRDPQAANTTVRVVQLDADGRAQVPARSAPGLLPAQRGVDLLAAALDEGGLTLQERDAFLRAWRTALFGAGPGDPPASPNAGPDAHPLAPVADALLYFWPRAEVDAALPLSIEPTPREVRRVFAVRVDLATGSPAAHGHEAPSASR